MVELAHLITTKLYHNTLNTVLYDEDDHNVRVCFTNFSYSSSVMTAFGKSRKYFFSAPVMQTMSKESRFTSSIFAVQHHK